MTPKAATNSLKLVISQLYGHLYSAFKVLFKSAVYSSKCSPITTLALIFVCVEMVDFMKRVAALDEELTVEERNLISVAYKNVIGARRASWRILSSLESKEESKGDSHVELTRQYKGQVSTVLKFMYPVVNEMRSVLYGNHCAAQ